MSCGMKSILAAVSKIACAVFMTGTLAGCATIAPAPVDPGSEIMGTSNAFASHAIYFLLTDRFADGDPANNFEQQGCPDWCTFNRELVGPEGETANIGYLGGDLKGVLNNADYIADMGFTMVWTTPLLSNPNAAFSGDKEVTFGAGYQDGGKTGYHGYWTTNFFEPDEHVVSDDLDVETFITRMRDEHGLGYVIDIVGNHGSPSYTMPKAQPEFGKVYGRDGELLADHMNLHPTQLDPREPLHAWFNREPGLAKLSDFDPDNEEVLDYLVDSYLFWLSKGPAAVRVDTIREQPHRFWKKVSDRLRAEHPSLFMFGESYSFDAGFISQHTRPENGGYSVLDFPGREAIVKTFEDPNSDFNGLLSYLHLDDRMYENPYELVTFIDNHDMARMDASDEGFINAFNWLFTSRGVPAVYYGSEVNFMRGKAEHHGNRNFFGQARIDAAPQSPIHAALTRIANVRKATPALQRGVQVNLSFKGQTAAFYRVLEDSVIQQTALVLLNKSSAPLSVPVQTAQVGTWRDVDSGEVVAIIGDGQAIQVPSNGVRVLIYDQPLRDPRLREEADRLSRAVEKR